MSDYNNLIGGGSNDETVRILVAESEVPTEVHTRKDNLGTMLWGKLGQAMNELMMTNIIYVACLYILSAVSGIVSLLSVMNVLRSHWKLSLLFSCPYIVHAYLLLNADVLSKLLHNFETIFCVINEIFVLILFVLLTSHNAQEVIDCSVFAAMLGINMFCSLLTDSFPAVVRKFAAIAGHGYLLLYLFILLFGLYFQWIFGTVDFEIQIFDVKTTASGQFSSCLVSLIIFAVRNVWIAIRNPDSMVICKYYYIYMRFCTYIFHANKYNVSAL